MSMTCDDTSQHRAIHDDEVSQGCSDIQWAERSAEMGEKGLGHSISHAKAPLRDHQLAQVRHPIPAPRYEAHTDTGAGRRDVSAAAEASSLQRSAVYRTSGDTAVALVPAYMQHRRFDWDKWLARLQDDAAAHAPGGGGEEHPDRAYMSE